MDNEVEQAIAEVQAGDERAYGRVVCAYRGRLRAAIAARCPPGLDPDDIAQQAFVEAYEKISRYESNTEFYAWLWVFARYILLHQVRGLQRRRNREQNYVEALMVDRMEERLSANTAADSDRMDALRRCMARLADNALSVLRLRYVEGRSLKKISEKLGRSLQGVKSQLFTIRTKLRECINQNMSVA